VHDRWMHGHDAIRTANERPAAAIGHAAADGARKRPGGMELQRGAATFSADRMIVAPKTIAARR